MILRARGPSSPGDPATRVHTYTGLLLEAGQVLQEVLHVRQAVAHVIEGRDLLGQHVQGGFDLRRGSGARGQAVRWWEDHGWGTEGGAVETVQGGEGARAPPEGGLEGNFLDLREDIHKTPLQLSRCDAGEAACREGPALSSPRSQGWARQGRQRTDTKTCRPKRRKPSHFCLQVA